MDTHQRFQEDLVTYLMGELSPADRAALDNHLKSCAQCRKQLELHRKTLSAAGNLPEMETPENFAQDVMHAARAAKAQAEQHHRQHKLAGDSQRSELAGNAHFFTRTLTYQIARTVAYAAVFIIALLFITNQPTRYPANDKRDTSGSEPSAEMQPMYTPDDTVAAATADAGQTEEKDSIIRPDTPYDADNHASLTSLTYDLPSITVEDMEYPPLWIPPPTVGDIYVRRVQSPVPEYASRFNRSLKRQALRNAGMDIYSENAVLRGLWWLARHQDANGKWDADGYNKHCTGGKPCTHDITQPTLPDEAVTGAALLAMLADGNTPATGRFRFNVARGINWLICRQQADGYIGDTQPESRENIIAHSIAAAALAETYGMTGEARYKIPAQKAINYLLALDLPLTTENNTLRTAEVPAAAARMFALNAAETARLDIPQGAPSEPAEIFAAIAKSPATAYTYPLATGATSAQITPGMLALIAPAPSENEALIHGATGQLRSEPPDWSHNGQAYWLCGSMVLKHAETTARVQWNSRLQDVLVENQAKSGHAIGSWQPRDAESRAGGTVFATALTLLALETPYR